MTSSRREPSLRAQARAHYLQAAQAEKLGLPTSPELPAPTRLSQMPPALNARARPRPRSPSGCARSTKNSVVPVREIARLCGVTERTIYKYARKLAWSPRVTRLAGDGKPTAAGRAGARGRRTLRPARRRRLAACARPQGARSRRRHGAQPTLARAPARRRRRPSEALERRRRGRPSDLGARSAGAGAHAELLTGALVDIARLRSERRGRLAPRAQALALRLEHAILDQMGRSRGRLSAAKPAIWRREK